MMNSERFAACVRRGWLRSCAAVSVCLAFGGAAGLGQEAGEKQGTLAGTVTDHAGKPVAGALVRVNRWDGLVVGDKWAMFKGVRTDEKGRFTMPVRYRGESMKLKEIWADKKGCVRDVRWGNFVLNDRQKITIDFRIAPGEILAGRVAWPLTVAEKMAGVTEDTRRILLRVVGKSYRSNHLAGKGGAFEIYVPPGEYTIEVFVARRRIKRDGIRAPARDLVIQPPKIVISPQALGKAFDALWADMDRSYSYFFLRKVDWPALRDRFRPQAVAAKDLDSFTTALRKMLTHLKDVHIWIDAGGEVTPTYISTYKRNWNARAMMGLFEARTPCGRFATVGKTRGDGFGYLLINQQTAADADSVAKTIQALRKLRDAPGFLVDLRGGAGGGNEELARPIARLFCAADVVYAKHKYRAGPKHDQFGRTYERVLKAGKDPFTKPVVCLIGNACISSGEAFVLMMKALPHVTTVGERTRGASGNPRPVELPGVGITVWYPRWVAMTPDGTCFEGKGIEPDVELNLPASAYADKDPTLAKALETLREKVARARK